ncbi:MAG: hypothetical protein K2K56_13000 [Lachnospiraceae bacterium]|nr:hypothetical protein [Lachnospiraceae bacterium]MDE6627273.1 hypothetical protein [Lachnospiraceae bacterium]
MEQLMNCPDLTRSRRCLRYFAICFPSASSCCNNFSCRSSIGFLLWYSNPNILMILGLLK